MGDFGVATVMGDARTKTRTMVGSMNWMAPEVGIDPGFIIVREYIYITWRLELKSVKWIDISNVSS